MEVVPLLPASGDPTEVARYESAQSRSETQGGFILEFDDPKLHVVISKHRSCYAYTCKDTTSCAKQLQNAQHVICWQHR